MVHSWEWEWPSLHQTSGTPSAWSLAAGNCPICSEDKGGCYHFILQLEILGGAGRLSQGNKVEVESGWVIRAASPSAVCQVETGCGNWEAEGEGTVIFTEGHGRPWH